MLLPRLPATGRDRSWVLLLLELLFTGPPTISAGRSFHSVSGRAFWKETEVVEAEAEVVEEAAAGGVGEVEGGGGLVRGGPVEGGGGAGWEVIGGRLTAAARTAPELALVPLVVVVGGGLREDDGSAGSKNLRAEPGPMCRRTTHAVSGRSLK